MLVDVVIPALNEEKSIAHVLHDIPKEKVRNIYVCDNGSIDKTFEKAQENGAIALRESRKGYGSACLRCLAEIAKDANPPELIIFLDADYSDFPEQIIEFIDYYQQHKVDLIIGSRVLGQAQKGSLTSVQQFGNWLSTKLIKWIYQVDFTDLGPFRAIRYTSLVKLDMCDPDYGWTVEMQVKAAKAGLNCAEIPVSYKVRIGKSKVSGTIKGSFLAGKKILGTIIKHSFSKA